MGLREAALMGATGGRDAAVFVGASVADRTGAAVSILKVARRMSYTGVNSNADCADVHSMLLAHTTRARIIALRLAACAVLLAVFAASGGIGAGEAASSGTVVSASVPSATRLVTAGCRSGVVGRTDIGIVLPGSTVVTTDDCTVTFGSSNDTSRIRMYQLDGGGDAMFRLPSGVVDGSVGGGAGFTSQTVGGMDTNWNVVRYAPDVDRYYVAGLIQNHFGVARYLPNGTLDTGWSTNGWEALTMIGGTSDYANDLVIQPDGRIVVTGRQIDTVGVQGDNVGVAVFTAAGVADTSWGGGDGWISIDLGGTTEMARSIAIQQDGKFVLAGDGGPTEGFVVRLNADGSLDTTFGNGDGTPNDGIANLASTGFTKVTDVAVDEAGLVYATGRYNTGDWSNAVWRLLPNGTPDPAFSGNGRAEAIYGTNNYPLSITLLDDGRVVTTGYGTNAGEQVGVAARFTSAGLPDPTFGGGAGVVAVDVPTITGQYLAGAYVLPGGAMYVVGGTSAGVAGASTVFRLTAAGALDPDFDGDGARILDVHITARDGIESIAFGRDGRIVAVGTSDLTTDQGNFVALTGTPVADYGAGATFAGAGQQLFGACLNTAISVTTTGWTEGACVSTDSAEWQGIPDNAAVGSVATAASGQNNASIGMRFGMRALTSQPPGTYIAPIAFEVVAPG